MSLQDGPDSTRTPGADTLNRDDFTAALEAELQLHSRPFSQWDVLDFIEASWPLIADQPDVGQCAEAFLAAVPQETEATV